MELPTEILILVLEYLNVKEIYLKVAILNTELSNLTRSESFTRVLMMRDLQFKASGSSAEVYRRLLRNASCYQRSHQQIDFYGFATNGGVDVDMPYLWVRNMFEIGDKGYSTKEDAFNVNCAAVLDESMKHLNLMTESVLYLRRLEGILGTAPQEVDTLTDILHSLYDMRTSLSHEHRDVIPEYIRVMQTIHKYISPNVGMLTKASYTDLELTESIDFDKVEASRKVCCLHGLKISRVGSYTCPVASLIVFCSMSYVSVNSPEFEKFNNLVSPEQVHLAHEIDSTVPDFSEVVQTDNHSYLEFMPSGGPLVPLLWLRFNPNCLEEAVVWLSRRCLCKFLYVKLIDCENRMEARGWVHDRMNIDIKHVLALGTSVSLD